MDRKYGSSEENRIFRTISYFLSLISYFSCVAMTNKTTKHTSIVNRLHGHYRWQKFLYTLVFDLLLVGVAVVTWGLTLESAVCGVPFLSEAFRAAQRWVTWEGIHISPNLTQLFEGLEYHVRLELNPHWIDAPELLEERMWPEAWVVQRSLDKGVKFAFGSDAHVPERVGHMLPQLRAHPIFGQALRQWENT